MHAASGLSLSLPLSLSRYIYTHYIFHKFLEVLNVCLKYSRNAAITDSSRLLNQSALITQFTVRGTVALGTGLSRR